MARILIPSPTDMMQLAVLRGLGRRGHYCETAWSAEQRSGWLQSRYCSGGHIIPVPAEDPRAYIDAVLDLCRKHAIDAVVPTSTSSLEVLVPVADELARVTNVLLPDQANYHLGMDKIATLQAAGAHGFHVPDYTILSAETDLAAVAAQYGYPVVLKHRRNFSSSYGVRCVTDEAALLAAEAELLALTGNRDDLIVQQFLPGTLYDACVVAARGRVAAMVTQARRLMYPLSGGVAATLVTVNLPQLTAAATRMVEALSWHGPAQFEFKWDASAEQFALIEINPRFWATTGAWLRAGMNFPAAAVDLALGQTAQTASGLPADLRFRYLIGRNFYALVQLARARGFAAMFDHRKYRRTWTDFDFSDPLPDLLRLYSEVKLALMGQRRWVDRSLPEHLLPAYEPDPPVAGRVE